MLQDPELIIHRLRLRYLSQIQDGIGERIIDFSNTKTNGTAFKIAGGDSALMDRCISPDIPNHDPNDFSNSLPTKNELVSPVSTQMSDDLDAGGPLRRTITDLSIHSKRSKNNMNEEFNFAKLHPELRDDEASDQSDVSTTEETGGTFLDGSQRKHLYMMDLHKKVSEEPKFEKISIRRRGISDASVTYRASVLPSPRRPTFTVGRNESETDLTRAAPQSILSEGFLPILPGAPYETPVLGLPISNNTPNPLDDYPDQLAVFDAADSDSDEEYEMSDVLTNALAGSLGHSGPATDHTTALGVTPPTIGSLPKTKPRPESVFQPRSGLTALIKASESATVNPLEKRFGTLSGKGDLKPLKLKIYRPTSSQPSKSFEVVIKTTATVLDAIGYALLRYMEEQREPRLSDDQMDPNYWTLRIVEDDGELDEDFPALERTRPISKFSFDEFAIVEATSAQIVENRVLTPDPLGARSALKTIPEVHIEPSSASAQTQGFLNSTSLTVATGPSTALPSLANSPIPSMTHSVRAVPRAPGASVLLKIRIRPDPTIPAVTLTQNTVLDVTTETYLGDVLDQVCKRRNLDKSMYTLRLAGSNVVVPSDRTIESLQGRTELLLVRKRPADLLTDNLGPRSLTPNAPIMAPNTYAGSRLGLGEPSSLNTAKHIPDVITSGTYQRWIVWRRQPMSFMGRQERILAIDGEYVHISPSESKTIFESPKTTSLHIGQIVGCKQSRKIPINFKIMIIKAGQAKRYDFEAVAIQEAETIVGRIKILTRNWASRTGAIRSSRLAS